MSIRPGRGCSLAMCVERRLVATRSPQNLQRAFPGEMWMRCTYEQHERLFAARQARRNATILSRLSSEDRRHSGNRGCFGTSRSETGLIPKNDSPTMGQASRESRGSPTQSSRQLRPLVEDGERSLEPSPGSRPPRLRGRSPRLPDFGRRADDGASHGQSSAVPRKSHWFGHASTELILSRWIRTFVFNLSSSVDEVD